MTNVLKPVLTAALTLSALAAPAAPPLEARVPVSKAELAVSLALPSTERGARVPGVLILPGSGPSTRAQSQGFVDPFVRAGFAVLTFDKRGCGASTGSWVSSSLDDMGADGRVLLDWLKARPEIDAGRVGLTGVSQGGWVAPLAASGRSDVAFIIGLTGGGVSPRVIETFDYERRLSRGGVTGTGLASARQAIAAYFAYLSGTSPRSLIESLLESGEKEGWSQVLGVGRVLPDDATRPAWSWVPSFDPTQSIRALRMPVLAVIGGRDRDPAMEVRVWQEALAENGHPRTEIRVVPGAGHVLSLGDSHMIGNFNVPALDAMAAWAATVVRQGR